MLHIMLNDELIEEREYSTWEGEPTVGQRYLHNSTDYEIASIIVDTRKGVCEVHLAELAPEQAKPAKACA